MSSKHLVLEIEKRNGDTYSISGYSINDELEQMFSAMLTGLLEAGYNAGLYEEKTTRLVVK